jgi:hypothetical protein
MVDFGHDMLVTMVASQGKVEADLWVKTYSLRYKKDGGQWNWFYNTTKVGKTKTDHNCN